MLMRCLRIDRIPQCMRRYITNTMGEEYLVSPLPILRNIYPNATSRIPIIMILSKGVDPYNDLINLAKDQKQSDAQIQTVALGDGKLQVKTTNKLNFHYHTLT